MRKLRVGILGQGRSGHSIHGYALSGLQDKYVIAAVVDPIEERRNRAVQEYSCEVFADYHELLERKDLALDFIVNATPSYLHYPITIDLLEKGFNVLCEKPAARKAEEVDNMVAQSKKSGKLLAFFQQSRFAPYFCQVRKVIDSGILGRIVQISIAFNGFARRWDWQCSQAYNGGNLLNTGPHPLDQALQLFGTDMMPEVRCFMDRANSFGDAEDYVKLLLKGPGRPVVDLEISSCCAYPCFTYNVQGTNGGLKGTMEHIDWKYFKPEEAAEQKLTLTPLTDEKGLPAYCTESLKWYEESWDVPADQADLFTTIAHRYYHMLYETIVNGAPLAIKPEEVRLQIAVAEECHRQNPLPRF